MVSPNAARLRPGAELTPLLTRIRYYPGVAFLVRLKDALDPLREAKLRRLAWRLKKKKSPYPSDTSLLWGILGGKSGARHCFQHVEYLLAAVGIAVMSAGSMASCKRATSLESTGLYDPPVTLVYDLEID